jgi:hypothetical protein
MAAPFVIRWSSAAEANRPTARSATEFRRRSGRIGRCRGADGGHDVHLHARLGDDRDPPVR